MSNILTRVAVPARRIQPEHHLSTKSLHRCPWRILPDEIHPGSPAVRFHALFGSKRRIACIETGIGPWFLWGSFLIRILSSLTLSVDLQQIRVPVSVFTAPFFCKFQAIIAKPSWPALLYFICSFIKSWNWNVFEAAFHIQHFRTRQEFFILITILTPREISESVAQLWFTVFAAS